MYMIERLLDIKDAVIETLNEMNMDGLLASEWEKLKDLYNLLQPSQTTQTQCKLTALPFQMLFLF